MTISLDAYKQTNDCTVKMKRASRVLRCLFFMGVPSELCAWIPALVTEPSFLTLDLDSCPFCERMPLVEA